MLQRRSTFSVKIFSLLLAIVLPACTNLNAVRDWSSTSLEATQFNEVVATYADTPERVAVYDKAGADSWNEQAKIRKEQAQALELQLSLVADYMAALSALSADRVTDFTEDVGELTESLQKTGQVSEATVGAVGKLATTLANAAAKGWQKRKVGELIEQMADDAAELKEVIADAKESLARLQTIGKAIRVVAGLADLAAGIVARDPQAVFKTAQGLSEEIQGA